MKRYLILSLLFFLTASLCAQEMTVQAPQKVYAGDNFTVRFTVNDKAKNFHGPSFQGFTVVSGPSSSSQTSMSIINGQMSRSETTSISYRLIANNEGTFTIEPASCTVGDKKIESKSVSITVEKMSSSVQQQRQQTQQQQRQQQYDPWSQQPQQATQINDNTLFARASVSKSNPWQGEQIIITYKIYYQVPLSQAGIDKLPGNKGFWSEDLSVGQQIKQYEETYNGQRYQVAEIRRGALFAQESGRLTIDPLDLTVMAIVQRQRQRTGSIFDIFDTPFNSQQAVEQTLRTNALNINVRSLPAAPDGFTGAVGNFNVKGGVNIDQVKTNEAITYRVTVSGSGNLMLMDTPKPEFPSVFEVYDPQIDDNIKKGDNGVSGSRTYEWVLIPRTQGSYTIPALKFIYFDPTSGQYITKRIEAQEIEVAKGKGHSSSAGKDDVQLLNNDINYIHPRSKLHADKNTDHAGPAFWIATALIICLTAAALIFGHRRQEAEKDVAGMRKKRATRMAKKRLKKAATYLGHGETEHFYEEIYKAIWGCIADKYNIPLSQLNRDSVNACLLEKQVPEEQQASIMKVLQDVDLARFGGSSGNAEAQKQSVYDQALNMIVGLE